MTSAEKEQRNEEGRASMRLNRMVLKLVRRSRALRLVAIRLYNVQAHLQFSKKRAVAGNVFLFPLAIPKVLI